MEKSENDSAQHIKYLKIKKWHYCDEGLHLKDVLEWVWQERLTRATVEKSPLSNPRTWSGRTLLPAVHLTFSVPVAVSLETGQSPTQ